MVCTCLIAPAVVLSAPAFAYQQQQDDEIEFYADDLVSDGDLGTVHAKGRVVLRRAGYTLEAGELIYYEKTGVVEAFGAVKITAPDGTSIFAPRARVENELKDAFVENVRLLLTDGAQVAAKSAERKGDDGITELERAVYSPCIVCQDGSGKAPLWQIKAVKVVHDAGKKRLYYDNATLEFLGIPVLWLPYFSHPDPSVDRASGLLPIGIKHRRELGFVVEVPYHHVFSKSKDMTITPILTSREGLVLAGEYRQRTHNGTYQLGGSVTYTDQRDNFNVLTGSHEFRGHITSKNSLQHNKVWRSSLDINWASDDTYLRRYDFSKADTLTSQYRLEAIDGRNYLGARTIGFQGLRIEDISGLTAHALPLVDAEWVPNWKPDGGTISVKGSAMALYRSSGQDTERLSLSANWFKRLVSDSGFILDNDIMVRSDFYNISEADQPDDPAFGGSNGSKTRQVGYLSSTLSYPLGKFNASGSQILEPIIQLTLAPTSSNFLSLGNEDSRAFELTDLNLFSAERAAGFDLWEDGSRITYGFRWQWNTGDISSKVTFGQSWRFSGVNDFVRGSGIEDNVSDFVGRVELSYKQAFDLESRFRLDQKTGALRRHEIYVRARGTRFEASLGYLQLNRNLKFINREDREELRGEAFYKINDEWSLNGSFVQDLTRGYDGVEYGVGASFHNECFEFSFQFRENFTRDRDIEPGTSIFFRIKLKSLG